MIRLQIIGDKLTSFLVRVVQLFPAFTPMPLKNGSVSSGSTCTSDGSLLHQQTYAGMIMHVKAQPPHV